MSGMWLLSLQAANRLFDFTRIIILARILSPEDFGLFGLALLSLLILNMLSQMGLREALIRKRGDIRPYLDTVWTIELIRGLAIAVIVFSSAPYIASFFKAPQALPIIRVVSFIIVFESLANVTVVFFQKELEFHKYFVYHFTGTIADFTVAIATVLIFRNVWALVFGQIAGALARCVISYILDPYRPKFRMDLTKIKELFRFGKWVLGSRILVFLINRGDDIFVGKFIGITMLAFYQMAFRIAHITTTEITHVISLVAFPAYSKLQSNIKMMRDVYFGNLKFTAFLSFPVAALIFVLTPDFTKIFLGDKWIPIVSALQVLALAGLIRSLQATTGAVAYASGKPKTNTICQIIRLLVLAVLIYPLTVKWGIMGTSAAVLTSVFVSSFGFGLMIIRILKCGIKDILNILLAPFVSALTAALVVFGLKSIMHNGFLGFTMLVCTGLLTYYAMIYLFDRFFNFKILGLIKSSLKLLRNP